MGFDYLIPAMKQSGFSHLHFMFVAEKTTKLLERWTPADLNPCCLEPAVPKRSLPYDIPGVRYELWLKGQDAIRRCSARGDAQVAFVSTNGVTMLWTLVDP